MQIGIIGSGSWATAIAKIAMDNGNAIHWWMRQANNIEYFKKRHHNPHYLRNNFFDTSTASAKVVVWNNNKLTLKNINGNFVSNLPIKAASSSTAYNFTSYIPNPTKLVQIDNYVNPPTANVTDSWTANTIITEYE